MLTIVDIAYRGPVSKAIDYSDSEADKRFLEREWVFQRLFGTTQIGIFFGGVVEKIDQFID